MTEVIITEDLTKKYGDRTVVNNVNLTLRAGEIYGFLGPNGAGKTTTLRMILGLIQPDSGNISIFGQSLDSGNYEAKSDIGVVGERDHFFGDETASEYLHFFAHLHGLRDYEDRMQYLLDYFDLSPFKDLLASRFSQGMKRKLNLIRSMIGLPKVLILDEPALGLDPVGIRQVRQLLVDQRKRGCSVMLSSHILSEIEQTADRVGIINKGVLLLEESVDAVRNSLLTDTRLTVELDRPVDGIKNAFKEITGVTQVIQKENSYFLQVAPGKDIRSQISQKVNDLGGLLIEMHLEETSLEEAFIRITQENINQLQTSFSNNNPADVNSEALELS